jgi:hypothetical protein
MKKQYQILTIFLLIALNACISTRSTYSNLNNNVVGGVNVTVYSSPSIQKNRNAIAKVINFTPFIAGAYWGATDGANIEVKNDKGVMEKWGKGTGITAGLLLALPVNYLFRKISPKSKTLDLNEENKQKWISHLKEGSTLTKNYYNVLEPNSISFIPKNAYSEFTATNLDELLFYKKVFGNIGDENFVKRSAQSSNIEFLKKITEIYPTTNYTKSIETKIKEEEALTKTKYYPSINQNSEFLNQFPDSKHKSEVEETLLVLASSIENCKEIAQRYLPFADKMDDLAFKLSNKDKTLKQKYVSLFPNGKYKLELQKQIIEIEREEKQLAEKQERERLLAEAKAKKDAKIQALKDAEEEKQQLAQEKAEQEEEERELKARKQQILANSNAAKWAKGDKICTEINNGILMGTIDDWNEGHSKARIKIVAGPAGLYEGEPILQGEYLWISAKGKGWHICLDDEINTATQANQAYKQVQQPSNASVQNETQKIDTRAVARYVKSFANFLQYKCNSGGATLSKPDIQINKTKLENGKYLVDITVNWVEGTGSLLGDVLGGRSTKKFSGVLAMDEYGCNAIMAIRQSNEFSFFGFSCLSNIPENDIDRSNSESPLYMCTKYIGAGCLDE